MLLRYFYDKRLAQASYLVGCVATGEAVVIDPARDIQQYLDVAAQEGLKITHVTETHIHADFVSGIRELAAATGARMYLSDMGTADWKYAFADDNSTLLHDGDTFMVGNVKIEALHTPGHTPEHLSFMLTDTAGADKPMGIFTGDFIFAGDVGRPDLLEEAAGFVNTKEPGARQQFHSVQRIKQLPDYLQIWPGHGAGSACGKALGAIPSTTLGYEKLFNPAFQFTEENAFVEWLLAGQPEPPRYFAQMKKVNKLGSPLLRDLIQPTRLADRAALDEALKAGHLVVDFRNRNDFAAAHAKGTVNIPASNTGFNTYVGWFAEYDAPFYFVVNDPTEVAALLPALRAIGVDYTPGFFTPEVIDGQTDPLPLISADELAAKYPNVTIIDVRGESEYQEKHIAGARHIPLGYLPRHLSEIPHDGLVVTQCASGYRSQIAASLLHRFGFTNVVNLSDGMDTWSKVIATEIG